MRGEAVEDMNYHQREREELAQVDYFLDQLARAVERGEVPYASYDTLAPRYLARRADLIDVITASATPAGPESVAAALGLGSTPALAAGSAPMEVTKAPTKPVDWTTVLLFLGAFLVIAASAIFAITVWDIVGTLAKLAFMGTLTVAFYAAGYFARVKLHLKAGSAALTVVGSAMLLFDSWIVISGYALEGPFPWAVALLVISAVYWFTEVRLGDRFYGIAGAAAQVGWWWLMAAGLHLEVPVRLAGIAVVAMVWQLLAERAREDASWGSLAGVLLWAAPLVELAAAMGIAFDAVTIGSPTWTLLGAAGASALSGAVVAWRSHLIGRGRVWVAGAAQIPLFVVLLLPGEPSWTGAILLAAATVGYTLFSLFAGGIPFAIAALGTEFLAATSVGTLLDLDERGMMVLLAVLALSWVLASRLAQAKALQGRMPPLAGLDGFMRTTWVGGFVLLAAASFGTLFAGQGVPLTGTSVAPVDVAAYATVLACWAAASLARRGPLFASVTTAWSFFTLAALVAWAVPSAHSTAYALTLLLLAAVWLAKSAAMERFYRIDRTIFSWVMRGVALCLIAGGLLAEMFYYSTIGSWHGAILVLGGALVFSADAAFEGPVVSASTASVLAVIAAFLAGCRGGGAYGTAIVASTAVALLLSATGAWLATLKVRQAVWVAAAAAGAGTLACVAGTAGEWALPGGLALATAAWVAVGFCAREPRYSLVAGLTVFAAVATAIAAVNPTGWVTLVALGCTGIALGSVAMLPGAGPGDSHSGLGAGFSLAGLLGLGWLAAIGWLGWSWTSTSAQNWMHIGQQGLVVSLLVLGAYVVVQATRWRLEPGLYAGYGVLLLAAFAEFGALDMGVTEWYSTALGLYLIAMGYLYASQQGSRTVPFAIDLAAVLVALGVPTWLTVVGGAGSASFTHTAWAVLLALAFVAAGIVLKVRAYLFGGAAALTLVTGYRTITYLAAFWWLVLGLIGTAMLVIALTWERQRLLLSETQRRLKDSFERWR